MGHCRCKLLKVTSAIFFIETIISLRYSVLVFDRLSKLKEPFLSSLLLLRSLLYFVLSVQFGISLDIPYNFFAFGVSLLLLGEHAGFQSLF